ncbi:MAG: SurA N-terminal domain-containing protein, partial [Bacteroidales bacterium]
MAVLEKIRVKLGIFITIVIAVALLSFIIDPDTLRSTAQMFSSKNEVGKMKGKNISYKSFYDELTYYTKLAELTANQNVNEEAVQSSLREAAWQSIFDKEVFIPKTKDAGINVADDEILDLTQGSQISPVLTKQPMFLDQNGNYNRENLIRFVQSISADATGNADFYWNYLENAVYKQQLYTKYASLLEKSNIY